MPVLRSLPRLAAALPAVLLAALLAVPAAHAQREGVLEIGTPLSELLVRQAAAGRLPSGSADAQPLSAAAAARLLDTLATRTAELSAADRALVARYRGEAAPPRRAPFGLYADGAVPLRIAGEGYAVEVEPRLYLSTGPARRTTTDTRSGGVRAFQASRGVRVAGHLGRHLFFDTRAEENQRRDPLLAYDAAGSTTARLGFVKLPGGGDTYDYFTATGAVGYTDRFVEVRLARDRNRVGPGVNSLYLSDYAAPYDQLQIRAAAGPFRYSSVFARLTSPERTAGNTVLPSRFGAFHQAGITVGRVDVNVFESVLFRDDTTGGNRSGFEIAYLNPVIFYRSVESEIGSGDNALLGASVAVRPVDGVRIYGQGVLDEFTAARFFDDYWANKWGVLGGVHTVDRLLPGLELRAEAARLRPFLYSHFSSGSAVTHYGDPLAYAAGVNAVDLSFFARYRPTVRVEAALNAARTVRGRNPDGQNVGADPRLPYTTRDMALDLDGVPTLTGVRQTEMLVEARLAYEVLPGFFAETAVVATSLVDAERGATRSLAGLLQLRWGVPFRSQRY